MAKLDTEASAEPHSHADLVVEQLFQRLLNTLPPNASVRNAQTKSLVSAVANFARQDKLELSNGLVEQLQILYKALFGLCESDSSQHTVFASESMKAVEEIEESSGSGKSLLIAVGSLQQASQLVAELKQVYKKAKTSSKHIEEFLGPESRCSQLNFNFKVNFYFSFFVESKSINLSSCESCDSTVLWRLSSSHLTFHWFIILIYFICFACSQTRLSDLRKEIADQASGATATSPTGADWKAIFDRLVASETNVRGKSAGAGLEKVFPSLKMQWVNVANRLLTQHLSAEFVPFLQSLEVDIRNKVGLHDRPSTWTVHLLRDAMKAIQDKDVSQHVAFSCHDFLDDLYPWHAAVIGGQPVELQLRLGLLNLWEGLSNKMTAAVVDTGSHELLTAFGKTLSSDLMGDVKSDAANLHEQLSQQVKNAMQAEEFESALFDKSKCETCQRVGAALAKCDADLSDKMLKAGEAAGHVLALCHACVLYSENKAKLVISSKPDRTTTTTLQSLRVTQSTTLGFFRKVKLYEVGVIEEFIYYIINIYNL